MKFMAIITFVFQIVIFAGSDLYGKTWTVDNNSGRTPDFSQITHAIASPEVVSGDTLYVAGSTTVYFGNINVTKRLVIIGPGFFLDENTQLSGATISAKLPVIVWLSGSEGSVLTGFETLHNQISTDSITITRNYLNHTGFSAIVFLGSGPISNVVITQNYVVNNYVGPTINTSAGQILSNVIVSNNYFSNENTSSDLAMDLNNVSVTNNVIEGSITMTASILENNIMIGGTFTDDGENQVRNNLADGTQFCTQNNNLSNINAASIFIGSGTTDGKWQLAVGSPAIGAGVGGVDAGMYGGPSAFVPSGLPSIPVIEFLSVPTTGSQSSGLKIHIKARGQN